MKPQGKALAATTARPANAAPRSRAHAAPSHLALGCAGVSETTLALADAHVVVPMVGFVESFNISVAAALILYQARSTRLQKLG
jgi:tRNA (guanosine-2'-O-)-methyltransferase